MPTYRIYRFNQNGDVTGAPEIYRCDIEQEAIDHAGRADAPLVELWRGARLIRQFGCSVDGPEAVNKAE